MTSKHRVAVLDPVTEEFDARWRAFLGGMEIDLVLIRDHSDDALLQAVAGASVWITKKYPVDSVLIEEAGTSLVGIIKLSNWPLGVDESACKRRGIQVLLLRQFGAVTVAEHAISLVLSLARQLIPGHNGVVTGDYRALNLLPARTSERSFTPKWIPIPSKEVYRSTLGIVGMGEIGRELAVRARAFSMRVIYFDRTRLPRWCEKDLEIEYCELGSLLGQADFVSLHVPHTKQTEHMIGKQELQLMKPSAYLVNASRGGVVDQSALVSALQKGTIAGAGLDVFEMEPVPFDDPLLQLPNVVLSPHSGGGSRLSRRETAKDVRSALVCLLGPGVGGEDSDIQEGPEVDRGTSCVGQPEASKSCHADPADKNVRSSFR